MRQPTQFNILAPRHRSATRLLGRIPTKFLASAAFCVCLCLSQQAIAQGDRGSVSGHIADPSNAALPGSTVTIVNDETNVSVDGVANGAGDFTFTNLNPGRYSMTISHPGFQTVRREHFQVDVGQNLALDTSLPVGKDQSQVVDVSGEVERLNTTNASLGMIIEEKSITDLPLIYGNPFVLELLAPGVTLSGVNPNIHVYDSGTSTVSVNGSALNSIDYKLDGAPDNRVRSSAYTPSTEFISQYRVSTASYDATQGHSSGGFVNTQLKSGTSRFHGSVFGYYQDPKINANTWVLPGTANSKPVFVREGGGIGGPIFKNKLFFFAGYEHSRQGNPNVQLLTVPTAAERNGDFSALLANGTKGSVCGSTPTTLTNPNSFQLFNPATAIPTTTTTTNTYNRTCIPGNIITNISPIAKQYLSYYPLPNLPGDANGANNFSYSGVEPDNYNAEALRLDYTASQRQNFYAHLLRSSRIQNNKNNYFPGVSGTNLDYENRGVALGSTTVLSPSTVVSAILSYTRFTNSNIAGGTGAITPTTIGMPTYLTDGLPASANSLPRIDLTGYTSVTTAAATSSFDDIWQGNLSISRQVKSHFLRAGFEYRRYLTNGSSGAGEQGAYVDNGNYLTSSSSVSPANAIGFSLAQFELGYLSSGSQTQNSDFAIRSDYYAGFLQDDWRATSRLTLNFGLRWEYESPDVERNNKQIVSFDFGAANKTTIPAAATFATKVAGTNALLPKTISPTGGVAFAGVNGGPSNAYTTQKTNFLPRVGFAFSVTPKTVLRGGYGIFFDSLNSYYLSGGNSGSTTTFLVPQQGYSSTTSITAPVFTNTAGTGSIVYASSLANPFPGGLIPATGNSLGTNTALGQNVQFLEPNPKTPYNQRWSIGIQQQLGQFVLAVDYVGNHGVHLPESQISTGTNTGGREYNNIPAQYYSTVTNGYDATENNLITQTVTNPFNGLIPSGALNGLASSTLALNQLLRPYPEYASINAFATEGMSIYNSLQAQLQRRFANGLSFSTSVTWSRTLDATTFLNPTDVQPWYGVSANDRPLRLAMSGIYELPWGQGRRFLSGNHGIIAQVVGGWQMQGVYQIQSGAPLTFNRNDVYEGGGNPGNSHWSRQDYKNSVDPTTGRGYWFNTSNWLQLATNAHATYGISNTNSPGNPGCTGTTGFCGTRLPGTYQIRTFPLRFNTLRADNLNQADVGIQRQFQLWKIGTLQFRVEAINVLNHPVYSSPNIDPTNALFGQIVSQANQPRVYQFAGFYRF